MSGGVGLSYRISPDSDGKFDYTFPDFLENKNINPQDFTQTIQCCSDIYSEYHDQRKLIIFYFIVLPTTLFFLTIGIIAFFAIILIVFLMIGIFMATKEFIFLIVGIICIMSIFVLCFGLILLFCSFEFLVILLAFTRVRNFKERAKKELQKFLKFENESKYFINNVEFKIHIKSEDIPDFTRNGRFNGTASIETFEIEINVFNPTNIRNSKRSSKINLRNSLIPNSLTSNYQPPTTTTIKGEGEGEGEEDIEVEKLEDILEDNYLESFKVSFEENSKGDLSEKIY